MASNKPKKKYTGKELGQLTVRLFVNSFLRGMYHKEIEDETSIQELRKQRESLSDEEKQIYFKYEDIVHFLKTYNAYIKIYEQQAQGNFYALRGLLSNAVTLEYAKEYLNTLPVIVTEDKYKELQTEKRIKETSNKEVFNLWFLLLEGIEYYTSEEKKPTGRNILEYLKKETTSDPYILKKYNRVMGVGYFATEDGTRSDSMSEEEWEDFILIDKNKEVSESIESYMNAENEIERLIISGKSESEARGIVTNKKEVRFYIQEKDPKEVNKWEILQNAEDFYPMDADKDIFKACIINLDNFRKAFSDVIEIILQDISNRVHQELTKYKNKASEEWLDIAITHKDLYKMDLYDFREKYVDGTRNIFTSLEAYLNGVAILKNDYSFSEKLKRELDIKDGRLQTKLPKWLENFTVAGYLPSSDMYIENKGNIELFRSLTEESLFFLNGFDNLLDIIAKEYDIDEIKVYKSKKELIINVIKNLEPIYYSLHKTIREGNSPTKGEELKVIEKYFSPVRTDLGPSKEDTAKAIEIIKNGDMWSEGNKLIYYGCYTKERQREIDGK